MSKRKEISLEEARVIGECLYLDWNQIDLEQFRKGLMEFHPQRIIELEDRPEYRGLFLAGQAVLAHMQTFPDYCTRLARLRAETKARRVGTTKRPRVQA